MAILAYSPLIYLVDSHVAIYKIYVLKNPITDEIFYVGQTSQELETRLYGHIKDIESNKPKCEYIQDILKQGNKPLIEVVETIMGTCYIDKMTLNEREKYWIKYYKSLGCTLLNIASVGINDKCHEYHNYLSSLKTGEAKWHYYYCGKTISGFRVYDEKRILADGFKFPQEAVWNPCEVDYDDDDYNPWENHRFLAKIGYRKSFEDKYSYVPCYKDINPEFYEDDY